MSVAAVLRSRRGAVYLADAQAEPSADSLAGVALLEADLLDRGYLLSGPLRAALAARSAEALKAAGAELLADIDHALGADRDHTPLFRQFPNSTPYDTEAFFVDRVLTVLFQHPGQPCVLCGTERSVLAVSPCAHLVCETCFDGSDFAACPICHRRLNADDPFLSPARDRKSSDTPAALPDRLRVLHLGGDATADATAELHALLARPGALSPQDADDFTALLAARDRGDLGWLPERIPGRETKARLLDWLLADPVAYPHTLPAAAARIDTVTDILRLLVVRSGGDPGLVDRPRFGPVPRPLRRALFQVIDGMDPAQAVEDLRRHRRAWIHAAERLHPLEFIDRYPRAALAFAALRGTWLAAVPDLAERLHATAAGLPGVDTSGDKITVRSWAGQVETALAAGDVKAALALLGQRPGELLRRLDHLLRLAGEGGTGLVLTALEAALPQVAPAVLLSALGEIRTRTSPGSTRVVFPRGGTAKTHVLAEERAGLPAAVVEPVVELLTGEVLRRAGRQAPVELAVIDAALDGVIAPFTERTASRALVTLPRGTELPVPAGRTLRLFLHWMESATSGRTDLDLSLAMFNAGWGHIGTCDYTRLRYRDTAAVHSGDLTSAPAPQGATEFVDLDLEQLRAAGVHHVVAVAFSFNNVAFEDLAEAFVGLLARDQPGDVGPVFDPRAVEQRFDLTGRARANVPLIIDVTARTLRWLDVTQGVTGTDHSVRRHANALADLGQVLTEHFASGARVSIGELAVWQAAARASTVVVRGADGSRAVHRRGAGESVRAFAARIGTSATDQADEPGEAQLAYLLRGDLALPAGSEVFALHPAGLDAGQVRLLAAADVVTALAAR